MAARPPEAGAVRRETFTTPGQLALDLRVPAGRIEVETGDGAETVVELEAIRDSDASIAAIEAARVELRERAAGGQELLVEVRLDERGFGLGSIRIGLSRAPEVLVRVRAPHGASLAAEGGSVDVEGRGRFSSAKVATGSGDVDLADVDGEASVTSASGDVDLGRVGDARVSTASGDIEIDRIDGSGQLTCASGDAVINVANGALRINTASGDVIVREAASSVTVRTASGDQRLDSVSAGEVALESASGDIRVSVRRGTQVWLDVRSRSGDATSDLDVGDDPPADGAPSLELRASSMSGDIHIGRAA